MSSSLEPLNDRVGPSKSNSAHSKDSPNDGVTWPIGRVVVTESRCMQSASKVGLGRSELKKIIPISLQPLQSIVNGVA